MIGHLKIGRIVTTVLVVVFIVLAIVLFAGKKEDILPLSTEGIRSCEIFLQNDKTVLRTDNTLYVLDAHGNKEHKLTLPSKDCLFAVNGAYILTGNKQNNVVSLYKNGALLGTVTIGGAIRNLFLNENGGFCVVHEEASYMSCVSVYKNDLNKLLSHAHDSCFFLSAALSPDNNRFAVSMIDYTQDTPVSEIRVYDIIKEEALLLWNLDYPDEIIAGLKLHNNGSVTILSDRRLCHFKKDGTALFSRDFSGKNLVFAEYRNDDYFFLAFENGTASDFEFYQKNGKLLASFTISDAISKAKLAGKNLALYSNDTLYRISHKGVVKHSVKTNKLYSDMVLCADGKTVVLLSENEISKMILK